VSAVFLIGMGLYAITTFNVLAKPFATRRARPSVSGAGS
jgi:hypothetical protein